MPQNLRPAAALLAALSALASLTAQTTTVLGTNFNAYSSNGLDGIRINGGTDQNISLTGGGSNTASPSGFWSLSDAATTDLVGYTRIQIPGSLAGGTAFAYGDTSVANSQFKKGAVFTTLGNFTYSDGTNNAQLRYAVGTSPNRGYIQLNNGALNDVRFNVLFEIKPGAPARSGWGLSFRYGTGGTGVDAWNNNTAAQNGSATAQIHAVNATTGELAATPAVSFGSTSLAGSGPTAALSATDSGASLGPGTYLLSIRLHGKTSGQRYTLDDLGLTTAGGAAEVILDNNSAGVTTTGSWTTATTPSGYYGSNYIHDGAAGKDQKTVTYAPTLAAGVYAVSIRYPAASGHSADVPVDVSHSQGLDPISIDQRSQGGVWRLLGNYRFSAGNSGYVRISNAGTTGTVVADAVKFTPIPEPSDVEVKAQALVSWNMPDGDGISCAQCHTPTGYDVAVFNFTQADLRRATAPHLDDEHADRIFAYILQQRRDYPPAGGLKNVETFRPFQPGGGVILGGAGSTNRVRDNAFADYLAANYLLAQSGYTVDTLAKANTALAQIAAIDLTALPVGIEFNKWSEAVGRSGANEGGRVAEWIPGIGQQPKSTHLTQWNNAVDAYVADPSDANFWTMFHLIENAMSPDPVNNAPASGHPAFATQARRQFQANNLFAHNELNKARGLPGLQFTNGVRPFPDQAATHPNMAVNWDVGDLTRINVNGSSFTLAQMPLRHQQSVWTGGTGENSFKERYDDLRYPWMWLGMMHDPVMWHSGDTTATLQLEYMLAEGWPRDLRMHNAFAAILLPAKRGLLPNSWNPPGRWTMGPYQNVNLRHGTQFLGYQRYATEEWDTTTTAYAAYRRWMANGYRALALRQTADIIANGRHFNADTLLNNEAEAVRSCINWADPANQTLNNQIIDALKAAVAQYPE
jgi:hypothetical protein